MILEYPLYSIICVLRCQLFTGINKKLNLIHTIFKFILVEFWQFENPARHSWGKNLLRAQLRRSLGKTGWSTVQAQLRQSWGPVRAQLGHILSINEEKVNLGTDWHIKASNILWKTLGHSKVFFPIVDVIFNFSNCARNVPS